MSARFHLGVFVLALALAPALGAPALGDDCADAPNLVVNVGLPYGVRVFAKEQNQIARSAMLSNVAPVFSGRRFHACPGKTQVNVAVGSDYQILDWLGRGSIDAAVVSSLTLDLLTNDGIDLLEITSPQLEESKLLMRRVPDLLVRSHGNVVHGTEKELFPALEAIWAGRRLQRQDVRFIFASHLTTAGFLVPVVQIHHWLEAKLDAAELSNAARAVRRDRFWRDVFDHSCFHFGERDRCRGNGEAIEFDFFYSTAKGAGGDGLRDHLVMRAELARSLFAESAHTPSRSRLVDQVRDLIQRTPGHDVPTSFRSHAGPEEYFGTRTFAFSVDESLRLLELNREIAGDRPLALVLPGGGVKAAFQSRLIDDLYGKRRLLNAASAASGSRTDREPLYVDYIVGTSGGALLGYFVARLGGQGPFELTNLLWYRNGGRDVVDNDDLFPGTDLPRYASLVAVLIVFCLVLRVACSLPHSWLVSPPTEEDHRPKPLAGRIYLVLALIGVVAVTPFLVRYLSGDSVVEQVSQIAGLLFATMLVVVMFADQCLIARTDRQEGQFSLRRAVVVFVSGLMLMFVPPHVSAWREARVAAGTAYLALLFVGYVAAAAYLRRSGSAAVSDRRWRVKLVTLGSLSALVAPFIEQGLPGSARAWIDAKPLFNLFVFMFVPFVVAVLLRPHVSSLVVTGAVSLIASLVAWDLSRPAAEIAGNSGVLDLISTDSKLDATTGALLASLGALLACFGGVLVLHDRPDQFRLEETSEFRRAIFMLILPLCAFVLAVLGVVAWRKPRLLTFFELTTGFWIGLVAVSVLASLVLVAWSHPRLSWLPGSQWVATTLRYLTDLHPNARFIATRHWRLLVVAFGGLFWWNFVIAPGLYGNRSASDYLARVDERFTKASAAANGSSSTELATRLIVTANVLEGDQKRWVVAVGADQPCPIPRARGAGIEWYRFRTGPRDPADPGCEPLDLALPDDRKRFRKFVFASGSPFPIFPAMRVVPKLAESRFESLVDGGFSNNTPLEVAAMAGAERVLIVNSSYPIEADQGPSQFLAAGPLVQGAMRLPAFLFERAQQSDRRSRENLFVVSLSPSPRDDWPPLAEFTSSTIKRVLKAANEDLGDRIGMVESWGVPRFQASLTEPIPRR